MAELTLHFEAGGGTDMGAAASALQNELQGVQGVESAETSPQVFQSVGPAEIVSVIQVATQLTTSATAFLTAVIALHAAWEKVEAAFPGLHAPKLEVGLKQIPLDQLTDEHRAELTSQ